MPLPDLLARPHHDGSALYVSNAAPALGETVTVRVRVPDVFAIDELHVRQVIDGEPRFADAAVTHRGDGETWWSAQVACHNPVTNYRFIIRGEHTGYLWLNGTGLHERDVPDAADFRLVTYAAPPAWAADAVVYQVFPDRFARSAAADDRPVPDWAVPARWDDPVDTTTPDATGAQLFGGDLDGVREHLDHLVRLGVNVLYLTPFFPARSNHRYDASSFTRVDPVLGGDDAMVRLVREAHERGIRVMGDLTTNHTGAGHEWFAAAQADPAAPQRDYYYFADDGSYAAWLGVPSLPKLDHRSAGLQRELFDGPDSVTQRWLTGPDSLDGWRVDVANMTGRFGAIDVNHAVARHMRAAMLAADPDALLVGEHCHDHASDAQGDGWHGVMNYSGFTRPVWTWLRDKGFAPNFLGSPLMVPRLGGGLVADTMTEFGALVPWRSRTHSFNLVGSHDTTRIRTLVGDDPAGVIVAAALLFTMPGIPMFTYGDEIGMPGTFGEDGRRPMPWDESRWDHTLLAAYLELIAARHQHGALREGGLRWVHADDDALVFLRESADESVLVHVARQAHEPIRIDSALLPGIDGGTLVGGDSITASTDVIDVRADGPTYGLWSWKAVGHGEAR
ncbi:glycoside hydrolase family 13 protein [Calidifontibacter sp. DB0510]|uniref:Glycoside hydrolase family 13 protein n=1 Tax=Metallococcus carri TaxID=1656884 RepID=A0A967B148_9MICO|nr:glycoside hydrolase family 13 protein [Metallococcus carri]NHN55543.1 glycoside hydrolase family 13 protein [Metallococcus carri]NOP38273.1 glycoside hydrolase family 13 protein [Calidifontibacter sp. DB2511S]